MVLLQVDGISSTIANLTAIIKGVLTLIRESSPWGKDTSQYRKIGGGLRGKATTTRGPESYITTSGVIPHQHTSGGMQGRAQGGNNQLQTLAIQFSADLCTAFYSALGDCT